MTKKLLDLFNRKTFSLFHMAILALVMIALTLTGVYLAQGLSLGRPAVCPPAAAQVLPKPGTPGFVFTPKPALTALLPKLGTVDFTFSPKPTITPTPALPKQGTPNFTYSPKPALSTVEAPTLSK